jgi:acyl carrier protein
MNPDVTGAITPSEVEQVLITNSGVVPDVFEGQENRPLEELGVDSLAVLELHAVVKDNLGIEIPDDAVCMSVTEIVHHINTAAGG